MSKLAQRVQKIKPSATLLISAKAAELKAQGKAIISLSAGEPDFDTPAHIRKAGCEAIENGFTRYAPGAGYPSLREAIVKKFKNENELDYSPSQILVSSGAKQSIYNLMQAVLNEGDEVIIPAPYWVSYPDMAILAGAKPVFIQSDLKQNFKITPKQLEQAITNKTKLFIINSPSNPTGTAYTKAELAQLGAILKHHPQIVICSDDIYEHILWTDEPFTNIVNACPELYQQTIVINGVSKAYAMTGWRIGYAAGDENIIKAMNKLQSQSTSAACSISQKAAEAALNGDQQCIKIMVSAYKKRHDIAVNLLNQLPGFNCNRADGAFYLLPQVEQAIANISGVNNDVDFAEYLLEEAGVAVVPGTPFGMPGYIRFSIALDIETFTAAVEQIRRVL